MPSWAVLSVLMLAVLCGCGGHAEQSTGTDNTGGTTADGTRTGESATAGAAAGGSASTGGSAWSGGAGSRDSNQICLAYLAGSAEDMDFTPEQVVHLCSVCAEEVVACAAEYECWGAYCHDVNDDGVFEDCSCSEGAWCLLLAAPELAPRPNFCPGFGVGGMGGSTPRQ